MSGTQQIVSGALLTLFLFRLMLKAEPKLFKQAMAGADSDKWYEVCMAEMQAHFENGTWELVQPPAGCKAIGSKWVFKIKRNADGSIDCYKAYLVAQGFSQCPGVDFTEMFAPTTKWAALHTVFALAAIEDMEMESINISNTYLNGELKDVKVYMCQPEGFESGKPGEVAHLAKGLYVSASLLLWTVQFQQGVVDPKQSRFDCVMSVSFCLCYGLLLVVSVSCVAHFCASEYI
jgi:hypothetical protein